MTGSGSIDLVNGVRHGRNNHYYKLQIEHSTALLLGYKYYITCSHSVVKFSIMTMTREFFFFGCIFGDALSDAVIIVSETRR
jgi:hypothetical protein